MCRDSVCPKAISFMYFKLFARSGSVAKVLLNVSFLFNETVSRKLDSDSFSYIIYVISYTITVLGYNSVDFPFYVESLSFYGSTSCVCLFSHCFSSHTCVSFVRQPSCI